MPTLPFYDEWKQDEAFTASPDAVKAKALQLYFDDNLVDDEFRNASPALQEKARQLFMSDHLGQPNQQPEVTHALEPEPEEERSSLGAFARTLTRVPENLAAKAIMAVQGQEGASIADRGIADRFVNWVEDRNRKLSEEYKDTGDLIPGLISNQDVADLGPNLSFSGVSMAGTLGGMAAAAAVPVPGARIAGGMAGGAVAAYRMDNYQVMNDWLEKVNQESISSGLGPISKEREEKFKEEMSDLVSKHGAWEAGPEGIGNMLELSLLTAKNIPGVRWIPKGIAGKVGKAGLRFAGVLGTETATETVTQMGQQRTESEAGMSNEPPREWTSGDDILESAKEVFPQVLLLSGFMGASGAVYRKAKHGETIFGRDGDKPVVSDSGLDAAIKKGAKMAAEDGTTRAYKGLVDSGNITAGRLENLLGKIDPNHPVAKEIKANLQKLTSDQAPPIELTEDMVVEEKPIELTDDMIVDQPIDLPGISEPSGKSAEESAAAIEQAEAQTERVRQSPEGYQNLKKQLADRAEEADQIGSYLESYHSSLNEGTPGGRFRTEDLDGTQQWHGEASSYKGLPWWQEGFSKRKAMKAIEWGLSGKPLPDSERGKGMGSIWDAALEGAKEQYAGDVSQWAKEVEADPKAIDGMTPIQYKKALGVLKDEGFETKPIEDAWRGYTGEIQESAVKAIAGQQNISEEEIRSILENEQEPDVTFEAVWEDLSDADREFIDGHREAEATPTEPATPPTAAVKEKPMPEVAPEEKGGVDAEKGEPKNQVHDYSSTQVNLPESDARGFQDFGKKIPDSEIYEDPKDPSYGREDEPHITVKYGLDTVDPKEVEPLLSGQGPITAKMGKVSIFESDDYDVVKVDIESAELHAVNKKIAENLKVTDTYPKYKPHATIAYVKKGEGQKYVGDSSFEGKEIVFDSLTFSGKDGKLTEIPLKGEKVASEPPSPNQAPITSEKAPKAKSTTGEPVVYTPTGESKIAKGVDAVSKLPPLDTESLPIPENAELDTILKNGRAYYENNLMAAPIAAPAFNGGKVVFDETGWEHVTDRKRLKSEKAVRRRIKLLPKAKAVVENAPFVDEARDNEGGNKTATYGMLGLFSDGSVIRVVVEAKQDGDKTFLSVFDWEDVSKKIKNQPPSPKLVSLPESSGVGEAPHDGRGKENITPKKEKVNGNGKAEGKEPKGSAQFSMGRAQPQSTRAVKTTTLPESLSKAFAMGKLSQLKGSPGASENKDYRRAKYHGDIEAADRVALRMLNEKKLAALDKALDPDKPILFVPVVNSEKNNQLNVLPHQYAKRLSKAFGGTVHEGIVKTSGKPNTGATLEDRVSREIEFDGTPPAGGVQIVIVDDNFTSGKTTMALLGHLQSLGADVRAVTTMAYSARNGAQIKPTENQLDRIREYAKMDPESQGRNIDDYIREVTGHDIDQYAGAEANAVAKKRSKQSFRSFYSARNVEGSTSARRGNLQEKPATGKIQNAPTPPTSIAQTRESNPQSLAQLQKDVLTWLKEVLPSEVLQKLKVSLTPKISLEGKNVEASTRQWGEIDPSLDAVMGAATVGPLKALIELSYSFDNATIQESTYHEAFHVASKWLLSDADYARLLKFYGNEEKAAIAFQGYAMQRAAGKGHAKGRIRQIFDKLIRAFTAIRNGLKGKGFGDSESVFEKILNQEHELLSEDERMARVGNLSSLNMGKKPEISDDEFVDALLAKHADKDPGHSPAKFSRVEVGKDFEVAIKDVAGRKRRTWPELWSDIRAAIKANGATRVFDRFNPIHKVGEDAYRRYRLTTGAMSTFSRFLEDGKLALDENMAPIVQTKGKGVLTWMKTLGPDAEKMLWWVAIKRAEQLETEGREHWLTKDKRDQIMATIPDKPKNGVSWEALNAKFQGFNKNILDYAQASGLIDPEARKEWEQEFYVPFYRLRDESMDAFLSGPMKSGKHISAQIKRLTGQDARLGDLFENTMKNWAHLVQESSRNVAAASAFMGSGDVMSSMVDVNGDQLPAMQRMPKQDLIKILGSTSEKAWAVKKPGKRARKVFDSESDASDYLSQLKPGFIIEPRIEKRVMMAHAEINNIMSFRAEGAPVHVKINDVELFNAMTNANAVRMNEFLGKMLGGPKRVLTYTATFGPAFRVANMLRDTVHTSLVSKSFIPFLDTAIGMGKALKQDKDWISFQSSGAGQGASYLHAEDPKAMASYVKRVIKKDGTAKRILDTPKKLKVFLDWWEKIGAASEDAARVQLFAKRIAEGESRFDAAFEARDLLDFTMRGDSHIVQYLIQGLPFMNARIQGLYKLGRVAKADAKSFGVKMCIYTLADLALWAFGQDDDDFDEHYGRLEGWEKRIYHNFWIGDYHFRIPRAFELGIFPMLLEATLDSLKGTDEPVHVFKAIGHSISDTLAINPFPQVIRPLAEQWANKTFFTSRPIEGMGLKNLLPSQRKKPYTSTTLGAILNNGLADKLGVSPVRAEALIRGYLSTVGMLALGVSDVLVQNIGSYPVKPTRGVGDYPLIGRFMKNSKDQRNSKYLTRFYELSNEVNEIHATVLNYDKLGNPDAADKLVEDKEQELEHLGMLRECRAEVAECNRDTRMVMSDRDMSADEKRKSINEISEKKLARVEEVVRKALGQTVNKKPRKRVVASIKDRANADKRKDDPKIMSPKTGAIAGERRSRPVVRRQIIGGQR